MNDMLMVCLTAGIIAAAAILIFRKWDSKLVFFLVGVAALFAVTLITGESVNPKGMGNAFVDVFDVVRLKFVSTVSGTGIRLMVVAGYVMLMNHMKASNVLAAVAGKVLIKLKSPYLILAGVYIVGSILKIFITSQVSLGLLFMATLFPILVQLGVSKLSAASVMISIGMVDQGPNDSSAIFGASDVMVITPMEYFMNYEIYVGFSIIAVLAVVYALYSGYRDRKDFGSRAAGVANLASFSARDYGVPLFYGLFPVIPLVFVVVFSFSGNLFGRQINMDIITANVIGFIIVFLCDWLVTGKIAVVAENLKKVFEWMGQYFTNIVVIIVAAGVFSEAIKQMRGIDILAARCANLTGAAAIAMTALSLIIFGTGLLTGSGNAPWFAFGPLTPGIAATLGTNTALLAVPMHLAGGIGRSLSPFCGGVIAIAGVAEVEIGAVIRRNIPPLAVAYLVNLAASSYFFG